MIGVQMANVAICVGILILILSKTIQPSNEVPLGRSNDPSKKRMLFSFLSRTESDASTKIRASWTEPSPPLHRYSKVPGWSNRLDTDPPGAIWTRPSPKPGTAPAPNWIAVPDSPRLVHSTLVPAFTTSRA